jgi:DNA-binding MarR family transcriptional regulator
MPSSSHDKEITLLEVLKNRPDAGQRDMAEAIGLSLGMTNLLLKDLSARGWMLMRKLNPRKVQYVLTPEGMKELSRRSYRFVKKTIRSVADCREKLEALVVQVKASGEAGLILVGQSGLDFVLDYLCRHHEVAFRRGAAEQGWFVVYGEDEVATPNLMDYVDTHSLAEVGL